MENINFLNLPKKPKKTLFDQGDRFIPNRNAFQHNLQSHKLEVQDSPSNYIKDVLLDQGQLLKYKQSENALLSPFDILQHSSQIVSNTFRQKQKTRVFPEKPEKILDAPEIVNDYYLNLLDWGQNGILAVSLGNAVYLLLQNGEAVNLMTLPAQGEYVGAVNWLEATSILAVGKSDTEVI